MPRHLLVGLAVVLGACLQLSLAARAASWEDEPRRGREQPDGNRDTWGDFFSELADLLRILDLVWLLVAAGIVVLIACWQPAQIVGDTSEVESDGVKWTPPTWYTLTTLFASLSSHAAGILGFVGFQKIVVARIVSTSQPRANWSAPNFLLLTSIAISITAIFASLVFMGVDYLRRLAIDGARSRGYRLNVVRGKLERTGLGMALIMLTFVLIALYMLVIYTERQNSKKQETSSDPSVNASRDMQIFLDKACSGATVLLYFFNLRSLCESPKVQFHQTLASAGEDLDQISIKDYLAKFCKRQDERSKVRSCVACVAHCLAGQDLGLLIKMGTRRALFPNQRLAPLMHVVAVVMLLGLFPGIFQFATEQLFVDPQILEVRGISAHMLPAFAAESKRKNYVLLLGQDPSLHVKTRSAQTSSIELCCETDPESLANCTEYVLERSLIQFDEKPAILKIPAVAATNCSLTARGLSKKSWTTLELMVELQDLKHVCGCSKNDCSCCDGYEGGLVAEGEELQNMLAKDVCTPVSCAIKNSNQKAGPECRCSSGFVGDISWNGTQVSGTCTPAPCYVEDSNRKAGHECQCKDGFSGEVSWNQSEAVGPCRSANCSSIRNSIGVGTDCKCRDGFAGNISWNRSQPLGSCVPAPGCAESIEHSVGEGLQCECQDGFTGNIRWRGAVPQGSCQAAECNVVNSNRQPGLGCRCLDGYQGDIKWQKSHASGACTPARCTITNSNQEPGQACACLKGYKGEITWNNATPLGECWPASCAHIANSRGAGPGCHCSDGFVGEVTWSGSKASGDCKPAECAISNSNMKPGPACKCNEGFCGYIYFVGSRAYGHCSPLQCLGSHSNRKEGLGCGCEDGFQLNGSRVLLDQERAWRKYKKSASRAFEVNCVPAPCNIEHSNMKPGKECRCADGYYGSVRWEGADPTGSCKAASCWKQNSNRKPGLECKCSDGFAGQITWSGQWESGTCLPAPCNISNSNGKPGKACMCLDGFLGEIVWTDDTAHGSCKPALCSIRNSNLQPGPDCKCKDGFRGSISWDGSLAKGACKLVPCRVLHSNFAPGPACRCLRGFFGRISWSGPNVTGLCAPRPLCRPGNSVYYITRLTAGLVDADNNTCRAGQAMLVRGDTEGVPGRYELLWTSAHALPPAKCKLEWLVQEAKNPDPKHFSLTSNCATTPGQPRCSSRIVYSATIRNTSYCACDASEASEHTLAEFRGSRCGYDLIKWESLTISPGSPDACTCNLSLPCSELPSEELPRACIHFAEPAVLSVSDLDDDDDEDEDVDVEEYFYIFYETGELLIASADLGTFGDQSDYRWISDGKNLLIRTPRGRPLLWHGRAAGSRFSDGIETLLARTVLPEWWKVKFQQDAALGSFNTDKLAGCEFSFKSNDLCYSARLGQGVWVSPAQGDCVFEDVAKANNSIDHKYMSSTFGIQTYRSNVPCYPTATFEEILVQAVDVSLPMKDDFNYTVASSPCRTTIRYMVDAGSKLSECHSLFK